MQSKNVVLLFLLVAITACMPAYDGRLKPRVGSDTLPISEDGTITVQPGDTVYSISKRHKVPISAIVRENELKRPYILKKGQTLRLPEMAMYTVQPGDTYETLAARSGVTPRELAAVNTSPKEGDVQSVELAPLAPGQTITVPAASDLDTMATIRAPAGATGPASLQVQPVDTETHSMHLTPMGPSTTPAPGEDVVSSTPAPTPTQPGIFEWPLQGRILKEYDSASGGMNIAAPRGTPVTAAAGGTVVHAGSGVGGLGTLVLVRHEDGYVTAYAHLERVLVDKDSIVAQGDVIGTVGDTGGVKVPQLHFQVRQGETPLDPRKFLPQG
ncbi:MAG: peptidoglycan DD-metalloendopeptidase family protein [Bdellovibrionales bacterium]